MHGEATAPAVRSGQTEPHDFDAFWQRTLARTRAIDPAVTVEPRPTRLTTIDVFDVGFRGYGGDVVRAWLRMPRGAARPLAGVVQFTGYGNGRGHALRDLRWAAAGYAHLVVDARGQGHGDTADPHEGDPSAGSYLTRGLGSPATYYYRRVYADAVRAVEVLRSLDVVRPEAVGVVGASQGGGIALAMCGLVPDLAFAVIQAPALCELNRAAVGATRLPYSLLAEHFAARRLDVATALDTLRYFDGVNHAKRAHAPALLSTGLADDMTPPTTVLPAFTAYAGPKRVVLWPYNGHEAGGDLDEENALEFVAETVADAAVADSAVADTALADPATHRPTTTPAPAADDGVPVPRVRNP
jgi:cephalosporin-C deacetylase